MHMCVLYLTMLNTLQYIFAASVRFAMAKKKERTATSLIIVFNFLLSAHGYTEYYLLWNWKPRMRCMKHRKWTLKRGKQPPPRTCHLDSVRIWQFVTEGPLPGAMDGGMCSTSREQLHATIGKELFLYTQRRELGGRNMCNLDPQKIVDDYASQHMPQLFQEREYRLGQINKIFSSQWLNTKQVVFGTKCNKLEVMDLTTGEMDHIPSLKSSNNSEPASCPCGIHSITINPSKTLLATGAENTNDLAVYKLPTFDPVCVGERAHDDWIFDMCWLDDEFLVTGSRDSHLGLWRIDGIDDVDSSPLNSLQVPEYSIKSPLLVKECTDARKVRALAYHDDRKELAVLSLNAYFHIWDVETFKMVYNRKLQNSKENVCMCVSKPKILYAIGSQSHVNLVDPRSKHTLTTIISKFRGGGIRSVSFREDIITIGTGTGHILFFDLRAGKYLESGCGHSCSLVLGKGWLLHDDNYMGFFMHQYNEDFPNAIYTHQYDDTGTRLFVAGGPLPAGLWGNYAGLWS